MTFQTKIAGVIRSNFLRAAHDRKMERVAIFPLFNRPPLP
jgi:hypothetical protein